jgi:mannose-1-phosphate guanylyltransferase
MGELLGVILTAGAATRLRPLTARIPKAALPVLGVPVIAPIVERLIDLGVSRLVVQTGWLGEQVRALVAGLVAERVPLAFAPLDNQFRGLDLLGPDLDADADAGILVSTCDLVSDVDLRVLVQAHRHFGGEATYALAPAHRDDHSAWHVDTDGRLVGVENRDPSGPLGQPATVRDPRVPTYVGIMIANPAYFHALDTRREGLVASTLPLPAGWCGLEWDVLASHPRVTISAGARWHGVQAASFTEDVGTVDRLAGCCWRLLEGAWAATDWSFGLATRADYAWQPPTRSWIGRSTGIDPAADVWGSIVGPGSRVGAGVTLDHAVLLPGTRVSGPLRLRHCIAAGRVGQDAAPDEGSTLAFATGSQPWTRS